MRFNIKILISMECIQSFHFVIKCMLMLLIYVQALMKLKRKEEDLKQIRAQSQGNQTRLKYSNSELESIRKKSIPACQTASHILFLSLYFLFMTFKQLWYSYKSLTCVCELQEISKLRSELSNLEAQIEIQTESVELKDNEMKAVRDQINQVI